MLTWDVKQQKQTNKNPTLVNDIEIHPGIADHVLVLINANVKPYEGKQIPRSVPLYKKQTGKVSSHTLDQAKKIKS